ncbi:hypothetical protein NDU88_005114 [Pleurodeles waltl]|uniref:Uncharacterized protein n=1 Tax=Pleurodeles waltl TaxID=8319 RepID=A0AAV7PJH6_PLEWA|nr:hypothetical protein NDU88_005114 [Pleurodeles waltl]
MSPGQPGKFAQACFVGRASGDKERWKHGAAQGGEAAVQRVVRGSGTVWQVRILPDATGAAWVLANFGDVRYSTAIRLEPNLLRQEYGVLEVFSLQPPQRSLYEQENFDEIEGPQEDAELWFSKNKYNCTLKT